MDDEGNRGIKTLTGLQVLALEIVHLDSDRILKIMSEPNLKGGNMVQVVPGLGGIKNLGLRELHVTGVRWERVEQMIHQVEWHKSEQYYAAGGQREVERKLRAQLLGLVLVKEEELTEDIPGMLQIERHAGL